MFGLAFDEVVVIDRTIGSVTHLFPHEQKEALTLALDTGAPLVIVDAQGDHLYPAAAVLGVHFTASANYSQCSVHLWETPDGWLYLVDPHDSDQNDPKLWPIRSSWLSSRTPFRTIASRLCENTMRIWEVAGNAQTLTDNPEAAHVATWDHQKARVDVGDENAGQRAQEFIGADDLNAAAQRRA